ASGPRRDARPRRRPRSPGRDLARLPGDHGDFPADGSHRDRFGISLSALLMSRTATTLAVLGTLVALPASAAVLLAGYGVAGSDDAARAAAREDLAVRLQRAVVVRLKTDAARRAFPEGREFPLIAVELAKMGGGRYEARLTDASLAAYEREADLLAEKLRK